MVGDALSILIMGCLAVLGGFFAIFAILFFYHYFKLLVHNFRNEYNHTFNSILQALFMSVMLTTSDLKEEKIKRLIGRLRRFFKLMIIFLVLSGVAIMIVYFLVNKGILQ